MTRTRLSFLATLVGVAAISVAWTARRADGPFPHARHAKVFPTCEGCHAGIVSGDSAAMFPPPALCARCHDGHLEKVVVWNGPPAIATNLRFSHGVHAHDAIAKGDTLACATCHALGASDSSVRAAGARDTASRWMAVGPPRPAACLDCHAHSASGHLADDNACTTCHVSLADARTLPESTIAGFPRPASHARADFLLHHAPRSTADEARCATCHAKDSCERCHLNAATEPVIARLASDARVAHLVAGRPPVYPVPPDHRGTLWAQAHGDAARRNIATCANCHARPSCVACHIGSGAAKEIAALPVPVPGKATGVRLRHVGNEPPDDPPPQTSEPTRPHGGPHVARTPVWQARTVQPSVAADTGERAAADSGQVIVLDSGRVHFVRVHPRGFVLTHPVIAAAGQLRCTNCHEQRFCTGCHDGESRRRFHPANFLARHSVEAFGRENDCARCHNPEAFCRTCHLNVGLAARTRHEAAFHTSSLWLLQHGQAARQSLESCTTCHQERDCLRCHSTVGQGVNPHGPGFDAQRMQEKNPTMCLQCHLSNPLAGSPR